MRILKQGCTSIDVELANSVAGVYRSLPADEREHTPLRMISRLRNARAIAVLTIVVTTDIVGFV
jgi:hypothetical protein